MIMELVRKLKVYRNVGLFLCKKTCFVLHNSIYLYCGNEAMLKYTPMKDLTNTMKMFLMLGDMTSENQTLAQKVAFKQKIVFATMRFHIPYWEQPRDWNSLTDELKMERLTAIENLTL